MYKTQYSIEKDEKKISPEVSFLPNIPTPLVCFLPQPFLTS
jgi:hypothetical protein